MIYEGLGLSGYSPEASEFFELLAIGTFSDEVGRNSEGRWVKAKNAIKGTVVPVKPLLANVLGEDLEDITFVLSLILKANKYRMISSATKFGRDWMQYIPEKEKKAAVLLNALRELGRGIDQAGLAELEAADMGSIDGVIPQSVFSLTQRDELWTKLACPWLAELLEEGSLIHTTVTLKLYSLNEEMDFN
jgi:hypothetical protein